MTHVSVFIVKQINLSCSSSFRCKKYSRWMSAIPVVVICMLVIVMFSRAAALKGTMSFGNKGDFCPIEFVRVEFVSLEAEI